MDEPGKYPMLLEAIRQLCLGIGDQQRLTLVAFSGDAEVVASAVDGRSVASDVEPLVERIERCPFRFGETNLAPALRLALDELGRAKERWPHLLPRLYVMTDGQLGDHASCLGYTSYAEELGVEFTSYGFGDDFALDTMREIIGSCPGGGVKHIPDGATLKETFRHLAAVGGSVVASSCELELEFARGVIPGDAFLYRPVARWLPRERDDGLSVPLGPIETQRTYVVAFEARVTRPAPAMESIGTARARYQVAAEARSEEVPIGVRFADTGGDARPAVRDIVNDAVSLRDRDPESMLRALEARRAVYRREYRHPDEIESIERAIEVLERTGSLEELAAIERRKVEADRNTVNTVIIIEDRSADDASDIVDGRPPRREQN
jgi:hypothetical protein